jgi:uncharacterized protein (DUF952 family)
VSDASGQTKCKARMCKVFFFFFFFFFFCFVLPLVLVIGIFSCGLFCRSSTVYKLVTKSEWEEARRSGSWRGSKLDQADGFIHFSTAEQLSETARLHFKGTRDVLLLVCAAECFGDKLKFEPSKKRSGLFPHLFGTLNPEKDVLKVLECPLGLDDELLLPPVSEPSSPPSMASSGCPSPPSSEEECATPPSPPASPPSVELHEDPPLLPPPAVVRQQEQQGPFQPQNMKAASVSEILLFSFALVQFFVFLLAEADSFTAARGVGLIGAASAGWLVLGLLSVVKCPVKVVAKAQLVAAFLSIFFCSKLISFFLMLSAGAVVGLLSIPLWMVGALDMLFMFVQRHRNNRL